MSRAAIGTIILVTLLLISGTVGAIILNNHFITERQANAAAIKAQEEKKAADKKAIDEKINSIGKTSCLQDADDAYWSYVKLNATSTTKGADGNDVYRMPQTNWDYVDQKKKDDYSNCYMLYPSI